MTTRDLTKVATAQLRAEYEAAQAKIKELRAAIAPVQDELVSRDNAATLILNAVMAGQQALLRATGTPEEVIKAAEERFAAMRAEKLARKAAGEGAASQ
jgi:hypothetical protein